jgi:SAM-dependent methyltransferase
MSLKYNIQESGFYVINKKFGKEDLSAYYNDKCETLIGPLSKSDRKYYKAILKRTLNNKHCKILDVGCGIGTYSNIVPPTSKYFGIDFSSKTINFAKKTYPDVDFLCCSAGNVPFEDETFDFIMCLGSLEHFPSMGEALQEMRRILTSKGKIYLELPNLFFLGYYCRYAVMKKSPWSGQPFERLGGINSYLTLFRNNGLKCSRYWGRNYMRKTWNPVTYLLWNLGQYYLPEHLKENHCFLLEKES